MNNDNLKKTITKFVAMAILEADELPFVETAEYVAERLIAAGLGDVKVAEHRAEVAELVVKNLNDIFTFDYQAVFEQAEKELSEER